MDENWFTLDANLLREALEITPIDQAHPFVSPPSGDAIMDFVNELGYPEVIHFVSRMVVNHLYQPWREILSMINQCLTGKTFRHDRPRYPVLQMLWGIITSTNVDYTELMYEEFVQAMQTFLTDKANLDSPTKKGRKDKPHVIPYCWFTKLIICEVNEVFGMPIPNELILNNIKNALYYNGYLEMVAKHDQKVAAEKEGKNKSASTKQPKSKPAIEKSSKPAPAPKPKVNKEKPSKASTAKPPKPNPAKEKSTKATPLQKDSKGKVAKVRTVKSSLQLVDEPDEELAHSEPEPEHKGEGEEFDMERAIQMKAIRPLPVVEGKGKAIVTEEQAAQSLLALHTPKKRSITDQFIFQRQNPAIEEASTGPSTQPQDDTSTNIVCDSPSPADAETGARSDKTNSGGNTEILQINEELGENVEKQVDLEEKTAELDQDQAGSDPGETHESRPPPEHVLIDEDQVGPDPRISRVALAGPDPEPTHDEFMSDLYPKVQESLKFLADEHVILEDLLSSTGTLSSMKNLEDAYAIGDLFINDKSTNDEPRKLNVEAKVVSMVTLPIYQASSSVPPLLTPVIDLSPLKPASSTTQAPIFTATKTTTPTNLPPPLQQQSTTKSEVYTLEHRDLPHKIDEAVCENVKEAVQIALLAPLRERFRDLSKEDMKEMLHQRMFESGTYKSLPKHIALYEALEASMAGAQRDEFLAETDKSCKRRRNDQDPPPPPQDSDLTTPEPAWVISTSHIPDAENNWANALASTYQALTKNSLLEKIRDMRTFMNWYCQKVGKTELTQADFEGQAYEVIDWANPEGDQVRIDISRPLPLSGPPGHVIIQTQFFFNKDLDYLRYGSEGCGQALSISKMKDARYHDFGFELLLLEHIRKAVKTYMHILNVVGIKAYSRYGYNYLKEITLRKADHQEYTIAKKDFKNLYPSDFEDLNLMLLQGHLNHLSSLEKRMLSTAVNLWTPNFVIRQRVEDLQLGIESYQK
ncbi:hypothetical protein Tco_1236637 [Tanacetum coccineum]